jgi:hypothetical protein
MVACKKENLLKQLKIWTMVGTVLYVGHEQNDLMEW